MKKADPKKNAPLKDISQNAEEVSGSEKNDPKEKDSDDGKKKGENLHDVDSVGINFEQTNDEGEIHPLTDEERLQSPGSNVQIVGDSKLLEQPVPERQQAIKKVDIVTGPISNEGATAQPTAPPPQPHFTMPPPPPMPPPQDGPTAAPKPDNFNTGFQSTGAQPQKQGRSKPADDPHIQTANFIHENLLRGGLSMLGNNIGVSTKKIDRLHNTGKLNKHAAIPYATATGVINVSIFDRILIHNQEVAAPFNDLVSDEWIEQNNPLLAGILRKKGAALSPEAQYGINLSAVILPAVFASIHAIGANNSILKELQRISGPVAAPTPNVAASAPPPPPPAAASPAADGSGAAPIVSNDILKKDTNKVESVVAKSIRKRVTKAAAKPDLKLKAVPPAPAATPIS